MRKLFLLYMLGGGIGISSAFAQVGINTTEPKGVFHVDAKGNTQGNSNISDDVIVDSNGNLGIGTLTPQAKVHIHTDGSLPAIRISDQSEAEGSMLMFQDNTGVVNWVPKPFSVREGKINDKLIIPYLGIPGHSGNHYEISMENDRLKLPPGIWMIMAKYMIWSVKDHGNLFWTYLHDLDDLSNLTVDETHLKDKRTPCLNPASSPLPINQGGNLCDNGKYNRNWYLASPTDFVKGEPSKLAMSVVGTYPEGKDHGFTTPYINYIAVIKSDGKKPGDIGYEHEIALTFSTSNYEEMRSIPGIMLPSDNPSQWKLSLPVGVYFFAIRLDIDESSL